MVSSRSGRAVRSRDCALEQAAVVFGEDVTAPGRLHATNSDPVAVSELPELDEHGHRLCGYDIAIAAQDVEAKD